MKKVVVITGASSGIGLETAKNFARDFIVYNLSRRNADTPGVKHIRTDISDEQSVISAFETIEKAEGKIDLLINNAGFGISGSLEFTESEDARRIFDVNFYGCFMCCKYALPLLRKTKGRIINISSAAAIFSIPFQGFYSASKAAINSFTLCLKNEVKSFGVSVCAVMPGDVHTGFTDAREKSVAGEEIYQYAIEKSVAVMERDEMKGAKPSDIAKYIRRIADKKKVRALYTPGVLYKFYAFLFKILPADIVNKLVGILYIKK